MVVSAGSPILEYAPGRGMGTATGDVLRRCLQCGTCSAVCPVIQYMDHSPRVLNALLLSGRSDELLRSRDIWVCTSCYACSVACPEQFPVTDSIYALKRAAMRAEVYPRHFITPVMVRQFVGMVGRRGRSSELWISLWMYLRTRPSQLLWQVPIAAGLLRRGRLRVRREGVRQPARIRALFDALEATKEPPG